uniref:DUF2892 domain-containing protein n=1 Tax=Steinernema glaseri TaxID=37863 RepID=A0A1I7Z217_9BILA
MKLAWKNSRILVPYSTFNAVPARTTTRTIARTICVIGQSRVQERSGPFKVAVLIGIAALATYICGPCIIVGLVEVLIALICCPFTVLKAMKNARS